MNPIDEAVELLSEDDSAPSLDINGLFQDITSNLKSLGLYVSRPRSRNHSWGVEYDVFASNKEDAENYIGITPNEEGETGVTITVYHNTSTDEIKFQFYAITSSEPGMGSKMVDAVMSAIEPYSDSLLTDSSGKGTISVHHDWSGGFWDKIQSRYSQYTWNLS